MLFKHNNKTSNKNNKTNNNNKTSNNNKIPFKELYPDNKVKCIEEFHKEVKQFL